MPDRRRWTDEAHHWDAQAADDEIAAWREILDGAKKAPARAQLDESPELDGPDDIAALEQLEGELEAEIIFRGREAATEGYVYFLEMGRALPPRPYVEFFGTRWRRDDLYERLLADGWGHEPGRDDRPGPDGPSADLVIIDDPVVTRSSGAVTTRAAWAEWGRALAANEDLAPWAGRLGASLTRVFEAMRPALATFGEAMAEWADLHGRRAEPVPAGPEPPDAELALARRRHGRAAVVHRATDPPGAVPACAARGGAEGRFRLPSVPGRETIATEREKDSRRRSR